MRPNPAEQAVLHREKDLEVLNFEQIHARRSERDCSDSTLPRDGAGEHSNKNSEPNDWTGPGSVQAFFVGNHDALSDSVDESGTRTESRRDSERCRESLSGDLNRSRASERS